VLAERNKKQKEKSRQLWLGNAQIPTPEINALALALHFIEYNATSTAIAHVDWR
jgi:hypothetical protein